MNLAYRWLQEYVKTTTAPEILGEKFRMTSSEMEGLSQGYSFPHEIVVGYVEKLERHPNADRLHVAQVKTGKETRTIVCGAPNIAQGQHVIVALPGAVLHPANGASFTIAESTIRGVTSEGMCCSATELGLPTHRSGGIIVLSTTYKPGTPATEALELNDAILDLEITPNRPDLLSYYGLAREVAAFEKLSLLDIPVADTSFDRTTEDHIEGKVENGKLCTRYSLITLEVPAIVDSPWWLQARLILAGIKPLNAVVDVTNYIMVELGQPLHAFDLESLPKSNAVKTELIVREAKEGEQITLLDSTRQSLTTKDIIIANGLNNPVALAGIMGGQETAIRSQTTRIILEAATFHGSHIRHTSRRLGLRSESSLRFEKGIDPELTVTALKRAVYLLQKTCGAVVTSRIHDSYHRQLSAQRPRISVSFNRIQQLLGVHIGAAECKIILQKLGFQLQSFTKSGFDAIPPSWRADVTLPEDVIEEIIRIWGYERIPYTLPSGVILPPEPNQRFILRSQLRHALAQLGTYELVSQAFFSRKLIEQTNLLPKNALTIPNPLSSEGEYLVPDHIIPLLQNISTINRNVSPVTFFEIGKVFTPPHTETEYISILLRASEQNDAQIRTAKMFVERMLNKGNIQTRIKYVPSSNSAPYFIADTALDIHAGSEKLGECGYIAPDVLSAYKIRSGKALLYINLNFESIAALPQAQHFYLPEPKYPKIERDVTVILDGSNTFSELAEVVNTQGNTPLLTEWYLADTYTGKPLTLKQKSYTLHFTYAANRTLTDAEVEKSVAHLSEALRTKLKAIINA